MHIAPKHTRRDLAYRNLANQEIAANETSAFEDPRLEQINEKVISYMVTSDPQDWNASVWSIYKLIFQEQNTKKMTSSTKTTEMTTEELQQSMNSAVHSNSSNGA